jgi:hypothetical protein
MISQLLRQRAAHNVPTLLSHVYSHVNLSSNSEATLKKIDSSQFFLSAPPCAMKRPPMPHILMPLPLGGQSASAASVRPGYARYGLNSAGRDNEVELLSSELDDDDDRLGLVKRARALNSTASSASPGTLRIVRCWMPDFLKRFIFECEHLPPAG